MPFLSFSSNLLQEACDFFQKKKKKVLIRFRDFEFEVQFLNENKIMMDPSVNTKYMREED